MRPRAADRRKGKRIKQRKKYLITDCSILKQTYYILYTYDAVNGVTFEAFVANKLVPNLWKGAGVVMDRAKIHLGEEIRELIKQAGA